MNVFLKFLLSHAAALVHSNSKSAFRNEDIDIGLRDLGSHYVAILFTTVVACVQHFHSVYLDDEHSSPNDMSCNVRSNFYAFLLHLNSKLYWANAL